MVSEIWGLLVFNSKHPMSTLYVYASTHGFKASVNIYECTLLIVYFTFVLKVVENVLKVNPVLGPQMFQPLLPSVFRGIIDGEVRVALTTLSFSFCK